MTASTTEIGFGHLHIAYDERVLEPRPWTAAQSTWAAELLPAAPAGDVLELCSGAGHIGLLAVADSHRRLVCVDLNPAACELTVQNAAVAGLDHRVEVRNLALTEAAGDDERFALVIADPPWVRSEETARYPEDPLLAIDGGPDGMSVAWDCVRVAHRHLLPGGSLVLQLGTRAQAEAVDARTAGTGLTLVEVREYPRGVLVRLDRSDPA